jgi:PAS domain S-box-containing protein
MSQVHTLHADVQMQPGLLHEVLLQVSDAVLVLDGEHRIILGNAAAERLLGRPQKQTIGRTLDEVAPCLLGFVELLEEQREGGCLDPNQVGEVTLVREGEVIQLEMRAQLVSGGGVALPWVLLRARDVTEIARVRAELGERERELLQAQKMTAVGELTVGLVHDFNNLLTAITGHGELALASSSKDAWRDDVACMLLEAQRAAALVGRVLDFSRPRAGGPRVAGVKDVLTGLGTLLRCILGKTVGLDMRLEGRESFVCLHPQELEQVIVNLVVNARDAMPIGGSVAVRCSEADLDLSFCRTLPGTSPGAYVRVSVSDAGDGMDPETLSRVFRPFFTTKEAQGGTGLGLAIVARIVTECGGGVCVTSEPGRGTTFDVYLPRVGDTLASACDGVEAATG